MPHQSSSIVSKHSKNKIEAHASTSQSFFKKRKS